MTVHFTLFSDEPTEAFKDALQDANIILRGWEILSYRYKRRRTVTNSLKIDGKGWIDPSRKSGDLKLTVSGSREDCPHHAAWKSVLQLADTHGLWVGNGGCVFDGCSDEVEL